MQAKLALKKSVGLPRTSYLSPKGRRLIDTDALTLAPLLEFFGLIEEDRTFEVRKLNNGLQR